MLWIIQISSLKRRKRKLSKINIYLFKSLQLNLNLFDSIQYKEDNRFQAKENNTIVKNLQKENANNFLTKHELLIWFHSNPIRSLKLYGQHLFMYFEHLFSIQSYLLCHIHCFLFFFLRRSKWKWFTRSTKNHFLFQLNWKDQYWVH